MSNETDLDWLARNVHVWPYGMREVFVRYPRNVDTLIWSCVLSNTGWITKEQWLSRRAIMQDWRHGWLFAPACVWLILFSMALSIPIQHYEPGVRHALPDPYVPQCYATEWRS